MDAVHNLGRAKTIIMIAHRLSTVQDCDTHHHDGARPDRGARNLRRAPRARAPSSAPWPASRPPEPRQGARSAMTGLVLGSWPGVEVRPQPVPADPARRARGRGRAGRELPRKPRHRPRRPRRAPRPLARQAVLGGRELGRGRGADRPAPGPARRCGRARCQARLDGARPRAARRPLVQAPGLAALRRRCWRGSPTGRSPSPRAPAPTVLAAYPALAGKPLEHIWHPAYPGEALAPGGPGGGARRLRLDAAPSGSSATAASSGPTRGSRT